MHPALKLIVWTIAFRIALRAIAYNLAEGRWVGTLGAKLSRWAGTVLSRDWRVRG